MHILLIISIILNLFLIAFVDFRKIETIKKLSAENKALKEKLSALKKREPETKEEALRKDLAKQGYTAGVIDKIIEQWKRSWRAPFFLLEWNKQTILIKKVLKLKKAHLNIYFNLLFYFNKLFIIIFFFCLYRNKNI